MAAAIPLPRMPLHMPLLRMLNMPMLRMRLWRMLLLRMPLCVLLY